MATSMNTFHADFSQFSVAVELPYDRGPQQGQSVSTAPLLVPLPISDLADYQKTSVAVLLVAPVPSVC